MSKELVDQIKTILDLGIGRDETREKFLERIKNEQLTRDEGVVTHLGVFIMGIDSKAQRVYIGHHKKSDRWIPHGGHVDAGETVEQTLEREIWEEWGIKIKADDIGGPVLLTITDIENPRQWHTCRQHFDVWFFVERDSHTFTIDEEVLLVEFHEARWMCLEEAREIVGDTPTVQEALDLVEKKHFFKTEE